MTDPWDDASTPDPWGDNQPPESGEAKHWPRHQRPAPHDSVAADCSQCGAEWQVHRDLAGFRFECDCGAPVPVPALPREPDPLIQEGQQRLVGPPTDVDSSGENALQQTEGEPSHALSPRIQAADGSVVTRNDEIAFGVVEARRDPERNIERDGLAYFSNETKRRVSTRTVLELVLVLTAFYLPHIGLQFVTTGDEQALYRPFASLLAAALILLACFSSLHAAIGAFRSAESRYYLEATLVAVLGVTLAVAWVSFFESMSSFGSDNELTEITRVIGVAMAIFSIGVIPAIFEEIAFRGLLQHRLCLYFGQRAGMFVTAAAFAVAHGPGMGLPFQLAIGYYLCVLRERSGSLVPGMVTHFVYNSLLVVYYAP